jgi:hypothetical protein
VKYYYNDNADDWVGRMKNSHNISAVKPLEKI